MLNFHLLKYKRKVYSVKCREECVFIHRSCTGRASLVPQLVKNLPAMLSTWVRSLVGKIPWRMEQLPTPVFWPGEFHWLYSPWGHKELDTTEFYTFTVLVRNPACQCRRYRRHGFDPWVRKIPWRRKWLPTPKFWPGKSHRQRLQSMGLQQSQAQLIN